jgi:hypothetical protein
MSEVSEKKVTPTKLDMISNLTQGGKTSNQNKPAADLDDGWSDYSDEEEVEVEEVQKKSDIIVEVEK